jgi:hypothetical protein
MGIPKRVVSGGILLALALGLVSTMATPAGALTSGESKFTSMTNAERSQRGIRTLVTYSDLVSVARRHSQKMADSGTIFHNNNLGNEVSGWYVLGENVGMGPTVEDIQEAFMNSQHHRENILDRDYNQIGVGVVIKDATIYVTVVFAGRKTSSPSSSSTTSSPAPRRTTKVASKSISTTTGTAAAPRPAAVPVAAPLVAAPRTVAVLVRLVGLDAARVNPVTGTALGL